MCAAVFFVCPINCSEQCLFSFDPTSRVASISILFTWSNAKIHHISSQKWKREKKVKWYFEKKISWFIFVSLFLHGFHSSCCDIYKQNEIWHDIRCSFGFNNIGFVIDLVCQLISLSICTFFDPFPLRNFFNWIHNPRTEIGKIDQLLADCIGTVFKLIPFNKTWALVT